MKQKFLQRDLPSVFFVFLLLFFTGLLVYLLMILSDPSVPSRERFSWACTTFGAGTTTIVVGLAIYGRRWRPD